MLGASRGEAGILGEGIRQALLRDPTYRRARSTRLRRCSGERRGPRPRRPRAAAAELPGRPPAGPHRAHRRLDAAASHTSRPPGCARTGRASTFWFRRRALRAARPRALELRHGQARRCSTRVEGATVHRMQGELGPERGRRRLRARAREQFGDSSALDLILLGSAPTPTSARSSRATRLGERDAVVGRGDARDGAAGVPHHAYASGAERERAGSSSSSPARTRPRRCGARSPAPPGRPRQPRCARSRATHDRAARPRGGRPAHDRVGPVTGRVDGREPVPADRRLRLPVRLRDHARWSRRAATSSGCACRGWTRRACSARSSTATPAASGSGRPTSTVPGGAPLPARHDGARDELGHARRLDHRPRRAADRARGTTRTSARTRTGARRPTTTPTTCCCARCAA